MLRAANQITGPAIIGAGSCTAFVPNIPEVPWAAVLLPAGVAGIGLAEVVRRRRRRILVID
jgi:hypothetical protein